MSEAERLEAIKNGTLAEYYAKNLNKERDLDRFSLSDMKELKVLTTQKNDLMVEKRVVTEDLYKINRRIYRVNNKIEAIRSKLDNV